MIDHIAIRYMMRRRKIIRNSRILLHFHSIVARQSLQSLLCLSLGNILLQVPDLWHEVSPNLFIQIQMDSTRAAMTFRIIFRLKKAFRYRNKKKAERKKKLWPLMIM